MRFQQSPGAIYSRREVALTSYRVKDRRCFNVAFVLPRLISSRSGESRIWKIPVSIGHMPNLLEWFRQSDVIVPGKVPSSSLMVLTSLRSRPLTYRFTAVVRLRAHTRDSVSQVQGPLCGGSRLVQLIQDSADLIVEGIVKSKHLKWFRGLIVGCAVILFAGCEKKVAVNAPAPPPIAGPSDPIIAELEFGMGTRTQFRTSAALFECGAASQSRCISGVGS